MSGNLLFSFLRTQKRKVSDDKIKHQTQQESLADKFDVFLFNDHLRRLVPFLDFVVYPLRLWLSFALVQRPGS